MADLKQKNSVERLITLGAMGSVLVLISIGWLSFFTINRLITTEKWVVHTEEVIATLESGLAILTDAETKQRGYLLTGDDEFLKDCQAAQAKVVGWMSQMRRLTADNPQAQKSLDRLEPMITQRLDLLNQRIEVRQKQGLQAIVANMGAPGQGRGRALMGQIWQEMNDMHAAEVQLLSQRENMAGRSATICQVIVAGGSSLACVTGVAAFFITRRDLRLREQAAVKLKENEALMESILDNTPAMVYLKDLAGRYLVVNRRFVELNGRSREAYLGQTVFELFPPEQAQAADQHFRSVVETGKPVECEEVIVYPDGPRQHLAMKFPVRDAGGKIFAVAAISQDVTERKRMEDLLAHERHLLNELMDNAAEDIYFKNRDGRFLRVNRHHATRLGLDDPTEAAGKSDFDFFKEDHARQAQEDEESVIRTGTPVVKEEKETWRDGRTTWVTTIKMPLRDGGGATIGTFGLSRDITDRKRAEEMRAELDRFFALSLDFLGIANADGYFKRVSPAVTDMLGWGVEEFLARPFIEFVHPDDQAATLREVEKQMQTGERVLRFENRYQHKNGSWRVLSWRSIPQPGGLMYATARDVTESKRVEQEIRRLNEGLETRVRERTARLAEAVDLLRHSERRFRALIERSADSISVIDAHNNILYLSPSVETVEGYTAEELIGRNGMENTHPHDLPLLQELVAQMLAHPGKAFPVIWRRRHKDGRWLWLEGVATNLLEDPAVGGIVTNYRDITGRKLAEEEVHELNATLEHRVRERTAQLEMANHELEAFSYSVSHDLRAPLRHIDGFVGLLGKQLTEKLNERERRYLGIIAGSARQMGMLIDDLLVFSRMSRMELRRVIVSPKALLDEAVTAAQNDVNGRQIRWKLGPLPDVEADPAMLRQVWVNLINNAVKYTRTRNSAEIEVGSQEGPDDEKIFFVRDNGVGFDMQYAHKLFGVFQRLHRAEEFEGTGIGLANVRRIVSRHGGRTWAEGRPDSGATFYFSLPKSKNQPKE